MNRLAWGLPEMGCDSPHRRRTSHAGSEPHPRGIRRERRDRSGLFWVLILGWWLFGEHGRWLVVLRLNRLRRVVKDRRLVFTSACSGAREDPPELGRLIAARRCLDSARPRWCPVRTARRPHEVDRSEAGSGLQFASPSELEALIKTTVGPILLGVCVCVFVAPV